MRSYIRRHGPRQVQLSRSQPWHTGRCPHARWSRRHQAEACLLQGLIYAQLRRAVTAAATSHDTHEPADKDVPTSARRHMDMGAVADRLHKVEAVWVQALGQLPPVARNRLLARCLRMATPDDPVAYDLVQQDTRDFLAGSIDAGELRDRFMAVYAAGTIRPQAQPSSPVSSRAPVDLPIEAETWFKELALLLPDNAKRMELLSRCPKLELLPHPYYVAAARALMAAVKQQAEAAGAVMPLPPGLAAASQTYQAIAEAHRPKEGDQGEAEDDSDDDTSDYALEQMEDWEDEEGPDEREFRGWQSVDRKRMDELVHQVLQQQKQQQQQLPPVPGGQAETSGSPTAASVAGSESSSTARSAVSKAATDADGLIITPMAPLAGKVSKGKQGKKGGTARVLGKAKPGTRNVLVWLRRDLRLHDNPALIEAARIASQLGGSLTFLYIHSPNEEGGLVGASLLWREKALQAFSADVVAKFGSGASVMVRTGPYLDTLIQVATAVGARHVFCSKLHEPVAAQCDEDVWQSLVNQGFQIHAFNALLLKEPQEVQLEVKGWHKNSGLLTSYTKAWERLPRIELPLKAPLRLPVPPQSVTSQCNGSTDTESLFQIQPPSNPAPGVAPTAWRQGICSHWDISERGALQALEKFLATGLQYYEACQELADGRAASRLSPYLHSGLLSPRLVWQRMQEKQAKSLAKSFYRRLIARDLAYWQLHHWPTMATAAICQRPEGLSSGQAFVSTASSALSAQQLQLLSAWQGGCTGYPLIDAGMRQLQHTGWMQQSTRLVCAAFLTQHLGLPWQEGVQWFQASLVDADLAINSMMWQNVAGVGLDPWGLPLLPTSKAQDPDGQYIKRWVPELAQLPDGYLHEPWLAPVDVLAQAGVRIGETYPQRVVIVHGEEDTNEDNDGRRADTLAATLQ